MIRLWKSLELEWKIFVLTLAAFVAAGVPIQGIFGSRLRAVLEQSVDPELEGLLRTRLETPTDEAERVAIVASIERQRQFQALLPTIVQEQRRAMAGLSLALLLCLSLVSILTLKRLTRPLRNLAVAVDKIGKGVRADVAHTSGGALGTVETAVAELQKELSVLREEARMQGMERAWQDIARVMAHEIKNPLTPIRLTLDRIEEKLAAGEQLPAEQLRTFADRINAQLDILERLVNQFRSFSREPEVRLAKVALHRSVAAVAGDMAGKIRTTVNGDATIAADPHLLGQVLLNIWKNSLEAGADRVDVTIVDRGPEVEIAIADNGPGIPPGDLERVWLPYVSLKTGGTGLGLPVVKKMAETMGGRARLESRVGGPNHGVTVYLTFRRRDEGDTAA